MGFTAKKKEAGTILPEKTKGRTFPSLGGGGKE